MTEPMPLTRLDPTERRLLPVVTVVPYVLLALLALTAPAFCHGRTLLAVLVLCAADAAWMLWMFTLHPAWRVRPRPMAVFFTGQVLIMFALVIKDPWFGFFTPAGYFYAACLLRWPWQLAGVASVAVVAATAQSAAVNKGTPLGVLVYVAVIAVNAVPLCGAFWLARKQDQAKDVREQSLTEVSEANRRLEATLAENAGLHEQLVTQAREAGILDERQRMAREIHDTLAQGLTGIITQLQAAEQAAGDPDGWRRHFAAATQLARESLSEARRSVDALRPEPLGDRAAERRAGRRGRPLVRAVPDPGPGCHDRHGPADAGRGRVRAAAHRAGGTGERGQARPGDPGRRDPFLPGERGGPGRPGRRRGVRTGSARGRRERRRPRRRVRPDRDAAADRGPGRDAAGGIRTQRHRRLGLHSGRGGGGGGGPVSGPAGERAPIRLLIADDHPVVRDGLSNMFARDPEFEVLGEAADGSEAVRLAQALQPDVILMDLRMPRMDGLTAITELARRGIPARVLVLTTYDTDSHVLPAIEAGATGYLLKDAPRDDLLRAVRAAAHGEAVLSPSVAARLMSQFRSPRPEAPAPGPLSQRELEVLELVAAGSTNREAAARLFISEATIKSHLLNIYGKLGVSDRAAAVGEAYNRGLLTPGSAGRS